MAFNSKPTIASRNIQRVSTYLVQKKKIFMRYTRESKAITRSVTFHITIPRVYEPCLACQHFILPFSPLRPRVHLFYHLVFFISHLAFSISHLAFFLTRILHFFSHLAFHITIPRVYEPCLACQHFFLTFFPIFYLAFTLKFCFSSTTNLHLACPLQASVLWSMKRCTAKVRLKSGPTAL